MAGRTAPSAKSAGCSATRPPWRALGLGSSAIGGIAAACYSHPLVSQAVVISGTTAAGITIVTALFGSVTTSARAFRLLRWLTNRPEPTAPPTEIIAEVVCLEADKRTALDKASSPASSILLASEEHGSGPA
jgi:hypothetical protein